VFAFVIAITDANIFHALKYFHTESMKDLDIKCQRDFRRLLALALIDGPKFVAAKSGDILKSVPPQLHARIRNATTRTINGKPTNYAARMRCHRCAKKEVPVRKETIYFCSCAPYEGICDACYSQHLLG
jgi:hypothetical protein